VMGTLEVGRLLYMSILCDRTVVLGLVIVIYVVRGMSRQRQGLMMTLIRVTAGSGFGVQLAHIRKVVGDFILLVLFRRIAKFERICSILSRTTQ
jgi:hypothetical protein